MAKRTIVVAIDASEHSLYALNWALHTIITPASDAYKLLLLHAKILASSMAGLADPAYFVSAEGLRSLDSSQDREVASLMNTALRLCEEAQVGAEIMVVVGDARDAICQTVEDVKADILVLGSHGYGAFKRVILGSVSDYCAHHAKCPVIIVKKPHTKHHDDHKSQEGEHNQHEAYLQHQAA